MAKTKQPLPDFFGKRYELNKKPGALAVVVQPGEFAFEYTTGDKLCDVERLQKGRCAAQLVFEKGKPMIQLCKGYKVPGRRIRVKDAFEAQEIATKYCRSFKGAKAAPKQEALLGGRRANKSCKTKIVFDSKGRPTIIPCRTQGSRKAAKSTRSRKTRGVGSVCCK